MFDPACGVAGRGTPGSLPDGRVGCARRADQLLLACTTFAQGLLFIAWRYATRPGLPGAASFVPPRILGGGRAGNHGQGPITPLVAGLTILALCLTTSRWRWVLSLRAAGLRDRRRDRRAVGDRGGDRWAGTTTGKRSTTRRSGAHGGGRGPLGTARLSPGAADGAHVPGFAGDGARRSPCLVTRSGRLGVRWVNRDWARLRRRPNPGLFLLCWTIPPGSSSSGDDETPHYTMPPLVPGAACSRPGGVRRGGGQARRHARVAVPRGFWIWSILAVPLAVITCLRAGGCGPTRSVRRRGPRAWARRARRHDDGALQWVLPIRMDGSVHRRSPEAYRPALQRPLASVGYHEDSLVFLTRGQLHKIDEPNLRAGRRHTRRACRARPAARVPAGGAFRHRTRESIDQGGGARLAVIDDPLAQIGSIWNCLERPPIRPDVLRAGDRTRRVGPGVARVLPSPPAAPAPTGLILIDKPAKRAVSSVTAVRRSNGRSALGGRTSPGCARRACRDARPARLGAAHRAGRPGAYPSVQRPDERSEDLRGDARPAQEFAQRRSGNRNDDQRSAAARRAAGRRARSRGFRGVIQQRPPAFSAIWIDGVRAFKIARKAAEGRLPGWKHARSRSMNWRSSVRLPAADDPRAARKERTSARSRATWGSAISGHPAVLVPLRRTAIGSYDVANATPLESLPERLTQSDLIPVG